METYENDYYSADELKAYAEEMLGVFESGNQSGSSEKKAEIAECTVKDGTAKLLITFPDAEEYLRFVLQYLQKQICRELHSEQALKIYSIEY